MIRRRSGLNNRSGPSTPPGPRKNTESWSLNLRARRLRHLLAQHVEPVRPQVGEQVVADGVLVVGDGFDLAEGAVEREEWGGGDDVGDGLLSVSWAVVVVVVGGG